VEIQKQQQGVSGVGAWECGPVQPIPSGEARYADGLYVNGDFFRVPGVQLLLGRGFTAGDDRIGCGSPGAVISYAFWQREFGGDGKVLRRSLSLDGQSFPALALREAISSA